MPGQPIHIEFFSRSLFSQNEFSSQDRLNQGEQKKQSNTSNETLVVEDVHIGSGQHWAIFSTDSRCSRVFCEILSPDSSAIVQDEKIKISGLPEKVGVVSLAKQQELLDVELKNDDTDFMDRLDFGSSVEDLIKEAWDSVCCIETIIDQCDLQDLRLRGFRQLSTGETRRLMLARALASQPDLLILDDPYAGLDIEHQKQLSDLLSKLAGKMQLIVLISREGDIPPCITHIALFQPKTLPSGNIIHRLSTPMTRNEWQDHPVLEQLNQLSKQRSYEMVELIQRHRYHATFDNPLVALNNAKVEYTDGVIFEKVNWRINKGEHWQIIGPNGCGKSTLLGLIIGDHPQCYSNDITIFGQPRGQGETIWQIKQNIGLVSSALHLQYRVNCSALNVLLSGFFDSIGLYQTPSAKQISMAKDWLKILHMSELENTSFKQLDYGQQRLLLIGRALIKQPALLILDEPYQGLDFINRKLVMNALTMIAEENLSQLLYVTHYPEDSLAVIKNFVRFVKDQPNSNHYQVEIEQQNLT